MPHAEPKSNGISWKVIALWLWFITTGVLGAISTWALQQDIANGKEIVRIEERLGMAPLVKHFDESQDLAKQ